MRDIAHREPGRWHHRRMPDIAEDLRLEYQRSLIDSVRHHLDSYQRLVPFDPANYQWAGEAKQRYGEALARFRESLWVTRAQVDEAHYYLEAVIAARF